MTILITMFQMVLAYVIVGTLIGSILFMLAMGWKDMDEWRNSWKEYMEMYHGNRSSDEES